MQQLTKQQIADDIEALARCYESLQIPEIKEAISKLAEPLLSELAKLQIKEEGLTNGRH